jgi:hypothetical protein
MLDDERDLFDSVLFVGLNGDDEVQLSMGNQASVCISYDCSAAEARDSSRCDVGFRGLADFQRASKRVDLVFFGLNTSASVVSSIIYRFARDDAVIVTAPSTSITLGDLSAAGCVNGRVLTLRRIGEVQVVGYEAGGDFGTRASARLFSEFVEPLGRVVVGAELLVSGVFKKPETLVGPYFIVAVEGATFRRSACKRDSDLVAVDLSNSFLRELPDDAFEHCDRLAAMAFPAELVKIGWRCFGSCTALGTMDLAATCVEVISPLAFSGSALVRASFPASLRGLDLLAFRGTPLSALDLRASASITITSLYNTKLEVTELGLPQAGFAALAATTLPGSRVEIIYADVDAADVEQLFSRLDEWAIDRLRVISPRLERPVEWVRSSPSRSVAVRDPDVLTAPSAVTLTVWRLIPECLLHFVRSIDLSVLGELPDGEGLSGSLFLESVVLPARLRIIPERFLEGCPRLSQVVTSGCVALEEIKWGSFRDCRDLHEFVFPSMVQEVGLAFGGTSMVCLDLSGTEAKSILVGNMKFLERLVLPRRCTLAYGAGLPALRRVTFGACGEICGWNPRELRFEGFAAPGKGGQLAVGACAFAEVACLLSRGSLPFPP